MQAREQIRQAIHIEDKGWFWTITIGKRRSWGPYPTKHDAETIGRANQEADYD